MDDVASYLRFYESAVRSDPPHALVDHLSDLCATAVDTQGVVLLRPQNDQTFETRLTGYSLRGKLRQWVEAFAPPPWAGKAFLRDATTRPDVYAISYPKYLGNVFLFYPLLGHELAHVLLEEKGLSLQAEEAAIRCFPAEESSADFWIAKAKRSLAVQWGTELCCDQIGFRVYGEVYAYALHNFLAPLPPSLPIPGFDKYLKRTLAHPRRIAELFATVRDAKDLPAEDFRRVIAESNDEMVELITALVAGGEEGEGRSSTRRLYEVYPSPALRVASLLKAAEFTEWPLRRRKTFTDWRNAFWRFHREYRQQYPSPEFNAIEEAAEQVSRALTSSLEAAFPAFSFPSQRFSERDLQGLLDRLARWIPPCEVNRGRVKGLAPADFELVLLAGWIQFIEMSKLSETDGADASWPLGWLGFMAESLDMASLYRSFRAAKGVRDLER